jgi:hypothetical protein
MNVCAGRVGQLVWTAGCGIGGVPALKVTWEESSEFEDENASPES